MNLKRRNGETYRGNNFFGIALVIGLHNHNQTDPDATNGETEEKAYHRAQGKIDFAKERLHHR